MWLNCVSASCIVSIDRWKHHTRQNLYCLRDTISKATLFLLYRLHRAVFCMTKSYAHPKIILPDRETDILLTDKQSIQTYFL